MRRPTEIYAALCWLLLAAAQLEFPLQTTTPHTEGGCAYRSPTGYNLIWTVDGSNIAFNLTFYNFPASSYTGVGFGLSMATGIDVILVAIPPESSRPEILPASVIGRVSPTIRSNSQVRAISASYDGSTLTAEFVRPINPDPATGTSLDGCVMWDFITTPGAAYTNGTFGQHGATPEQQQQCNITTTCKGTIPAQFLTVSTNGMYPPTGNQFGGPQMGPMGPNNQFQNGMGPQYQPQGQQPFGSSSNMPPFGMQGNQQPFGQTNNQQPYGPQNQYAGMINQQPIFGQNQQQPFGQQNQFSGPNNQPHGPQNQFVGMNNQQPNSQYPQSSQFGQNQQQFGQQQNGQFPTLNSQQQYSGPTQYSVGNQQFGQNQQQPFGQNGGQQFPNGPQYSPSNQGQPMNQNYGQNGQMGYGQGPLNSQYNPTMDYSQNSISNYGQYSQYGNGNLQQYQSSPNNDPFSQFGRRKKRQSSNIYGYNYNSNASPSEISLVQNPNYQFLNNRLADEYVNSYNSAEANFQYNPSTYGFSNNGGGGGSSGSSSLLNDNTYYTGTAYTSKPVLNNQQQDVVNWSNIQRDTSSGRYAHIAPPNDIYTYYYNTPSGSSDGYNPTPGATGTFNQGTQFGSAGLVSTVSGPIASANLNNRERYYDSSITSPYGNVFTGNQYGDALSTNSAGGYGGGANFDPSTEFLASANRGPQPGQQIVYYDQPRSKRSSLLRRRKRQVRFFDPVDNQTAMYYPYRTATNWDLLPGEQGFSQTGTADYASNPNDQVFYEPVPGSGGYNGGYNNGNVDGNNGGYSGGRAGRGGASNGLTPAYGGGLAKTGGGTVDGPGGNRMYDASKGYYVLTTPQFDSRGGNPYLETAPVDPQSVNFQQTLANNARALQDYTDPGCTRSDPYWCSSYVQQIVQAQNEFNSYSSGLCQTLISSVQYSDNRCCNALRAAGCQV